MKPYWNPAASGSEKKRVDPSTLFNNYNFDAKPDAPSPYDKLDSLYDVYGTNQKRHHLASSGVASSYGESQPDPMQRVPFSYNFGFKEGNAQEDGGISPFLNNDSKTELKPAYKTPDYEDKFEDYRKPIVDEEELFKQKHFRAEPIQSYFRVKATVNQILNLPLKPRLLCISGNNKGESIPLSLTTYKDIVGNGELRGDEVSVQINDPKLDRRHMSIQYSHDYQYEIIDLKSETGTWIGLKQGEPEEVILNKTYELGPYRFTFYQGPLINDIEEFFDMLNCVHLTDEFYSCGIFKLTQFCSLTNTMWEAINIPLKDKKNLQFHAQRIGKALMDNDFQDYRVIINIGLHAKEDYNFVEFGMKGIRIGPNAACEYKTDRWEKSRPEIEFEVQYLSGKYYLIVCTSDSIRINWVKSLGKYSMVRKLEAGERYLLKTDDILLMGSMAFRYDLYEIAAITEAGNKKVNEDRYVIKQNFLLSNKLNGSLFCVIDGHGGTECAEYLEKNLPLALKQEMQKELDNSFNIFEDFAKQVKKVFSDLDLEFHAKYPKLSFSCGATLCCIIILGEIVICCNVGDCRALIAKKDTVLDLSIDHRANRPQERERIESVGGFIQNDKLMGKMEITRCFGHYDYKKTPEINVINRFQPKINSNLLISEPEVKIYFIDPEVDDFILLFTHGMINGSSNESLAKYIRMMLSIDLAKTPEGLLEEIISEGQKANNWTENATCIFIRIPRLEIKSNK